MDATPEIWVPTPPGPPSTLQDRAMDLAVLSAAGTKVVYVSYDPTKLDAQATVAGANTGNGTIPEPFALPTAVAETWTITCLANISHFSVVGSVSGAKANAYVNQDYENNRVAFKIKPGTIAFVQNDSFTFVVALNDPETPVTDLGYVQFYREDTANLVEVIYTL